MAGEVRMTTTFTPREMAQSASSTAQWGSAKVMYGAA